MHYYSPFTLAIAALVPATVNITLSGKKRLAGAILGAAIAVHLISLGAGGRWGQEVDVARGLLEYAKAHPNKVFLTDIATINEMYALEGFRLPANVIGLNGPASRQHLLVNKEPRGAALITFPERPIDGILINTELISQREPEKEFWEYLKTNRGPRSIVVPVKYKPLFRPFARFFQGRIFAVKSLGGEVMALSPSSKP
jgi:hypothetical protein